MAGGTSAPVLYCRSVERRDDVLLLIPGLDEGWKGPARRIGLSVLATAWGERDSRVEAGSARRVKNGWARIARIEGREDGFGTRIERMREATSMRCIEGSVGGSDRRRKEKRHTFVEPSRHLVLAFQNQLVHHRVYVVVKGAGASDEGVEDDAEWPDVHFWSREEDKSVFEGERKE
jgi:hypothetical protein